MSNHEKNWQQMSNNISETSLNILSLIRTDTDEGIKRYSQISALFSKLNEYQRAVLINKNTTDSLKMNVADHCREVLESFIHDLQIYKVG